jgi:REP element-mobilizing transposase RayT
MPEHFPGVLLKEFVVMPNHIHGIIALTVGARYIVPFDGSARVQERFQRPTKASIPTIVRTFKAAVTRRVGRELSFTGQVWQRNYFERILRDGKDYSDASRYILENPMRWEWDKENRERGLTR